MDEILNIQTKNTDTLKALMSALSSLVAEAKLTATAEGLRCIGFDPGNVAAMEWVWSKEAFENFTYNAETPEYVFYIKPAEFKDALKRPKAQDVLTISVTKDSINLVLDDSVAKRRYKLPQWEFDIKHEKIPNTPVTASVTMSGARLADTADDLKDNGEAFVIKLDEAGLRFSAYNDQTEKFSIELRDVDASTKCSGSGKARFATEYFLKCSEFAKKADSATLTWKDDHPMHIDYNLPNLTVKYLFAPRVENN